MNKVEKLFNIKLINNKKTYSNLNFNLLHEIIKFLPLPNIINELIYLNKNTNKAINKSAIIKIVKKKFTEIFLKVDFDVKNLGHIKQDYFADCETYEINNNLINDAICFILNLKYKGNKEEEFYVPKSENGISVEILSVFISLNKKLLSINIMSQSLGIKLSDCEFISNAIKRNNIIQELYLGENIIGENDRDMEYLSEGLIANKNIKILWMDKNFIGINHKDAFYLAKIILLNKNLKEIILFSNYIGNFEEDLSVIFASLINNKHLELLDLSDNYVGKNKNDFKVICDLLRKTNLSCIDLGNNDEFVIKEKHEIKQLAEAVLENKKLNNLYMNNVFANDENKKLIKNLLKDKLKIFV